MLPNTSGEALLSCFATFDLLMTYLCRFYNSLGMLELQFEVQPLQIHVSEMSALSNVGNIAKRLCEAQIPNVEHKLAKYFEHQKQMLQQKSSPANQAKRLDIVHSEHKRLYNRQYKRQQRSLIEFRKRERTEETERKKQ